jgi:16S rRNA C1402 N4-methylase RsmH
MIRDGKVTASEVVERASLERLDDVLTILKRHRPTTEVCTALLERIARSPLDQFNRLKAVYFHHCINGAT